MQNPAHRFVYNCQKLEADKISFSKWMDKQILALLNNRLVFSAKMKWAISHEKTWKNLKCILLSDRSQSEKVTSCMIPTIWHSWKSNTTETVKISVVARGYWKRVMNMWSTEDFEGSKTTSYNTVRVDMCHFTFVEINRICNIVEEFWWCKVWTLGDTNVSA